MEFPSTKTKFIRWNTTYKGAEMWIGIEISFLCASELAENWCSTLNKPTQLHEVDWLNIICLQMHRIKKNDIKWIINQLYTSISWMSYEIITETINLGLIFNNIMFFSLGGQEIMLVLYNGVRDLYCKALKTVFCV